MLPDRVSNPGPLTYESGALPIALRGPVPTVVIWPKYCLKGCKSRVIHPPVPFHSKPGSEILFYICSQ